MSSSLLCSTTIILSLSDSHQSFAVDAAAVVFVHIFCTVNRIRAGIVDGCTENTVAICITVAVADSVIVVGAKQFLLDCARTNGLLASWHSVQSVCWFAQFLVCGCVAGVLLLLFASEHLLLFWYSYALTEAD